MTYRKLIYMSLLAISTVVLGENITEINKKLSSTGTGNTLINGFTFKDIPVSYQIINGMAILDGDMVIGRYDELTNVSGDIISPSDSNELTLKSFIKSDQRYRWLRNVVPYEFSDNVNPWTQNMFMEAIAHWEDRTAIRFVQRTAANQHLYSDYVEIISDHLACWSNVGRIGGKQHINIISLCGVGSTIHEIGHTLGLFHEHMRYDRDEFIIIHLDNVEKGKEDNFDIPKLGQAIIDGSYDYSSIMHYGAFAFSNGNLPTIVAPEGIQIGQRNGLSEGDIESIERHYPAFIPVAKLNKKYYSAYLGNPIVFDGSSSYEPNNQGMIFSWDLGNGMVEDSSVESYVHNYSEKGMYNISLTVTDPDGNSDTIRSKAYIYGFEVILPAITLLY